MDGTTYKIANTYYLRLPQGLQFTIEYPYQFADRDARMNDKQALAIVFSLMRHAYVNGRYKRTSVTKIGQGTLHTSRIGVVLVERGGGVAQGYRVALSLDEIGRRIATASTSSAISPSDAGE